jgi:hypothetical protein
LHCFFIEHVENTDSEWEKMAPVTLAANIFTAIKKGGTLYFQGGWGGHGNY